MADTTTPDTFNARTLIAEALAPSASAPQSNISPEFVQEAILQDRLGNEVTPEQNQIARDYDRLSYGAFAAKYGSHNLQAANSGKNTANNYWSNRALGNRTEVLSADTLKSIGAGFGSSVFDTIQGAVGLLPNNPVTEGTREGLSKASQYIRKAVEDSADVHTKAARDAYGIKQAADTRIAQRHFEENIQSGMSENVATMRRLASEGSNAIHNALSTGQYVESASNTFGSVLPAFLTGGIAVKGTGYLAEKAIQAASKVQGASLLGKAASVVANVNPVKVEAAKNLSAWAIANGLMEGGSASGQVLEQLKTDPKYSVENLLQNSPEYQERLQNYLTEHPDVLNDTEKLLKAAEEVKNQFDFDIVDSVGTKQGLSAAGLSPLSAGFMKWVTPGGLAKSKISSAIADAAKDTLEEPLTEMSGQYQQNVGIKRADKNQDEWEGVGEAGGQALLGTGTLGGTHVAGTAVAHATSNTVQNASQAYQNHQEVKDTEKVINAVSSSASSIKDTLTTQDSDLAEAAINLSDLYKKTQSNTKINDEGKEIEKTSADLVSEVDEIDRQFKNSENVSLKEDASDEQKKNVSDVQTETQKQLVKMKYDVQKKLKQKSEDVIKKITKEPNAKLSEQELEDLGNSLHVLDKQSAEHTLNSLPESIKTQLNQHDFINPSVGQSVKNTLNLLAENQAEKSTEPVSKVSQTKVERPKLKSALSEEDTPKSASETGVGILASIKYKNKEGKNKTAHFAVSQGVPAISVDGKVTPLSTEEFSRVQNSQDPDAEIAKVMSEHLEGTTDLGSYHTFGAQSFKVTNNKTKKYQIIKTNSDNFESGKQSIPMNQEARSVFFNPEATNEDKAEALRRQFDDYDAISVEILDEGRASQVLTSEASTQAEIQKAYRDLQNMDKTVSIDKDGSLVIEDTAPEEENKKLKEAFGSLGSKIKAVKRPINLMAQEAPLTALEDILSSKEKTEKFLRANKNTQTAGLLRKLFDKSNAVINRGYIDKDDNLASQIISFFSTESGFIQTLEPELLKAFHESEALKGIVLTDKGTVKNNFLEMFELAAGHWMATLSAYPHPMSQQELQRWNINAEANKHFMESSVNAGLYAPMAIQNLQSQLKRFMGVSFENTADINEVDKIFGEMASRIADAMIESKLLKVNTLEYVVPQYNKDTHEMEYTKTAEAPFLKVNSNDYRRLFQAKADILDALLNPTYKNRINYVPPKTRKTIVGTSIVASDTTIKAIEKANSIGAKINLPWLKLVASLGGNVGISRLFGFEPNDENRKLSVQKAWETQNGKYITRQTGFDHILEAIANKDPKTKLEDLQVYFSNAAIVNGRIMQEGAATYQNNKFLRQAYMYTDNKPVDLTDPETLKVWKSILAQKLGESVNKKDPTEYLSKVDKVIEFIKNSPDIQDAFNAILDSSNDDIANDLLEGSNKILSRNQRQQISGWIQSFNKALKEEGYAIQDEESLNAALEVFRYFHEDQKKFIPHIFLEIDGTNDGVSWANRLFGITAGMGPNWVRTNAKTGFMPLVSTYSQALLSNTETAKLLGTDGKNIHEQVSQEVLPKMLQYRIKDALSRKDNKQAQTYLKATRAFLDLADAVGWIKEGSVNDFMSGKGDIAFTKDISKKLTTIILYGSQIKGSTGQIVDMLFDGEYGNKGIYARISDMLGDITKINKQAPNAVKSTEYGAINAKYQQIRGALETLSKIQTKRDSDFKNKKRGPTFTYVFSDSNGEGMFTDLVEKLPGTDTLDPSRFKITSKNKVEVMDLEKDPILQNFALTSQGRAELINTLIPVFGEPAYAAVSQAIGIDSLKAARAPMIFGNIATSLARMIEVTKLRDLNKKGNVTQNDLYSMRKLIERVSPLIEYGGGAKVFAEKQSFNASQAPLYKGKQTATNFYPTRSRIDSSGVAFGALTTQGLGDTATAYQTLTKTSGNIGQVFDGYYTALNLLKEISEGANKGAREASLQRPIESIVKKLESVAKALAKEYPEFKGKEPEEVIGTVLGRFANQQYIDGTPMSARDIRQMTKDGTRDIQDELNRSLTSFENDFDYEPSVFTRRNLKSKNHSDLPATIMGNLKGQTRTAMDKLKTMAVVEKVNHEVLDRLPQTFHHMAGDTTPYVQGKAMSVEDAKSIFETITREVPNKFNNFSDVVAAYLTTKANQWAKEHLDAEDLKRYKTGTTALRGDIAPRELDQKYVNLIDEKIGVPPTKIKHNPVVYKNPSHVVARSALIEAFNDVGDKLDAKSIFANILNKAKYLLPKDIEVFMYSSKNELPEDVRLHFDNDKQQGIYIGGKTPRIYILDQADTGDWKSPKNQEVLVHEGIHAAVSSIINKWAKDSKSVSEVQRKALDNLDSLLKDVKFLQWPDEHKPKVIDSLQTVLRDTKDKAARVDESLAYILSNTEVLEELSKATLNADRARKHNRKLSDLLDKILELAHNAWARIIGIITGSPVEKYMKQPKNKKVSRDFLYYYGANTLTFFDENNYQKGRPDSHFQKLLEESAKKVEFEEPPIIRSSISLKSTNEMNSGARGYLQRMDLGSHLFHKYFTNLSYKRMKSGVDGSKSWVKGVSEEAKSRANNELGRIQNYTTKLAHQLSGLVSDPDETASAISKLLQEDSVSPNLTKDLTNIYRQFQERLDPYFLVPDKKAATQEELDYSQRMYNILTGNDHVSSPLAIEVQPETFNDKFYKQAIFYGIALTEPTISNALGELAYKPEKQVSQAIKGSFKKLLADSANGILNSLQKQEVKFKNASEVYKTVANAMQKNIDLSSAGTERGIFNVVTDKLNAGLMNIALAPFLKLNGWKTDEISALRESIQSGPTLAKDISGEFLRKFVNKAPIEVVEWLRELYGRVPSNSDIEGMLKEIRGYLDKTRKELLDQLPKHLQENFKDKKFKAKDKKFLSRTLGDTNISVLDFNTIKEIFNDRNKLNQKILDLQNILVRDNPDVGSMYVYKVKQLANYKMGNGKAGVNLLRDAEAIAHLWNQKNSNRYDIPSVSETTVANIRTLITLQNLSYLTDGDFLEMQKYLRDYSSGVEKLVNSIRNTLEAEQERAKDIKDKAYLYNKLNGWIPKGSSPRGEYIIVPADKVAKYKKRGYENLGKLSDTTLEKPHYRMYNAWVGNKTTQEGILQCINQTLFGWQINKGTNGEIPGSMIYEGSLVKIINESNASEYIPIFDEDGRVVGYERAVPKEDRDNFIDKNNDIFSGIAQYQTRQERESIAGHINQSVISLLKDEWEKAPLKSKTSEFEDVFHSKNTQIRGAVERLDSRTVERIKKEFGGDHCWIKKDQVWTVIGYHKLSIEDAWDNKFFLPTQVENALTSILDLLVPNGKARAYIQRGESMLMGTATWARETIIIRSGFVPLMNAIGNVLLLMLSLRMSPTTLYKLFKECLVDTERYNTLRIKEVKLKTDLLSAQDEGTRKRISKEIENIQLEYKNLPIFDLIQAGEYSTIDNEGTTYEPLELQKIKWGEALEHLTSRVNPKLQTTAKNLLMTKDSDTFQALAKFTNYGDWLAKAIAYRYLTEPSKNNPIGMQKEAARNVASTLFVDYDQFVGPERDWFNRIGLSWFLTFKYRMLSACTLSMFMNPGLMILGTGFESAFDLAGTPLSDNIITKLFNGGLFNSTGWGMMYRAVGLHPLAYILGS